MDRLVECVPNFSEGRKPEVVKRLVEAIESVKGAWVLDTHADADHNRSVITFVAEPEAAVEAAVRAARAAVELIDLRQHTGQHPRVGALDVLPFVPAGGGVTLEECIRLAHEAGERVWQEANVPVYFYESAARRPERARLEDVRRGGFEQLREEIGRGPQSAPDVGEARVHETAGACIVGARPLLIAFNVNLHTPDVGVARRVARAVRGRDGGLRYLKALGFELPGRGLTQVSMNLVDYEKTQLHHAFAAVRGEAERWGVAVAGSEIVGLIPQAALDRAAEYFLRVENFNPELVLENRIAAALARKAAGSRPQAEGGEWAAANAEQMTVSREGRNQSRPAADAFESRREVADSELPTAHRLLPSAVSGGGVAAAHAASLGAALGETIARLVERQGRGQGSDREAQETLQGLGMLRARLAEAAEEDAAAFARVLAARRLPRATDEEKRARANAVEAALKGATIVPLAVANVAAQIGEMIETLAELSAPGWLSDAAVGAQLALSAVIAARYNVVINTSHIDDEEFAAQQRARCEELLQRAREIADRVEGMLMGSLKR